MKKVVSATLAGALAVGMVPAMALADDAQLELMVTPVEAFAKGTVQFNAVGGTPTLDAAGVSVFTYAANTAQYLQPTAVQLSDESTTVTITGDDDYVVSYVLAGADGKPSTTEVVAPKEIGTYYAVVKAVDGAYAGATAYVKFIIAGELLDASVFACGYNADGEIDPSVTIFEYDATAQEIAFADGTTPLIEGKDYTVVYYNYGEDYTVAAGSATAPTAASVAGKDYVAKLTGLGKYAGQTGIVKFGISKYTLEAADVEAVDVFGLGTALPTAPAKVAGSAELAKQFKIVYGADFSGLISDAKVVAVDPKNANVANPTDEVAVTVTRYANEASFTYKDGAWPEAVTVVVADKSTHLASSYVEAFDAEGDALEFGNAPGKVRVVITDAEGNGSYTWAQVNANPGKYILTAQVQADTNYTLGGKKSIAITTTADAIDGATNSYFYYDADGAAGAAAAVVVSGSVSMPYNEALSLQDRIAGKLFDNQKVKQEITAGDGTEVNVYDANGKKVTTDVFDAGTYTVKIENGDYTLSNNVLTVTINPVDIMGFRIGDTVGNNVTDVVPSNAWLSPINGNLALTWTGNALNPDYEISVSKDANGKLVWADGVNPAYPVELVVTKDGKAVKEIKEIGTYKIELVLADDVAAKNYKVSAAALTVDVARGLLFTDVPTTHWAYEVIGKAAANKYVSGYDGTKLFGPDDDMTRAQAVCILYNMAGMNGADDEGNDDNQSYKLPYTDTDGGAWYGAALYWATEAGVVNGYTDGSGKFGPYDKITREQWAAMLTNYIGKSKSTAVADVDAVLATMPDGAEVSNWAKKSVAYMVSNKYMGNGGEINPTDLVTRAEAAAMAVNVQPYQL